MTEAGFVQTSVRKVFDIVSKQSGLIPSAVMLVVTVRALKYNGGTPKEALQEENLEALEKGSVNLGAHIENLQKFRAPVVVCINRFFTDTEKELDYIKTYCAAFGVAAVISDAFTKGGEGAVMLAKVVTSQAEKAYLPSYVYQTEDSLKTKIEKIAINIYGAGKIEYSEQAERDIENACANGYGKLDVCIAKTQFSLSPDKNLLGRPRNFTFAVTEVNIKAGAGFAVVQCGSVMLMPGLPKQPMALNMTMTSTE